MSCGTQVEKQKSSKLTKNAVVAELADAQASGACGSNIVWVQVPSSALQIGSPSDFLFFVVEKFFRGSCEGVKHCEMGRAFLIERDAAIVKAQNGSKCSGACPKIWERSIVTVQVCDGYRKNYEISC